MFAATINLTIFTIMVIIYLNEMRNISMFIYKFKYIKDYSKIIMEQKCNNIYCEAETDRYQIAKNSYNLLQPNDIFNSKTYIIMIFIVSIMIYIYYYYLLFDSKEINTLSYFLNFVLLLILIGMIILRYTPYDEKGYLNYFRDFDKNWTTTFKNLVTSSIVVIIPILVFNIKYKQIKANSYLILPTLIIFICFILSILLIFNIMNIVMSFRSNTKPILITEELSESLEKSFKILNETFEESHISILNQKIKTEYDIFKELIKDNNITKKYCKQEDKTVYSKTYEPLILYILKIFRAFNELSLITLKGLIDTDNEENTKYITNLKKIINDNKQKLDLHYSKKDSDISEVSFIFDKTAKIPYSYNKIENKNNKNENNDEYIYTADISYDNLNLFYEKYWDIEIENIFNVLTKFEYFVPTIFDIRPNIFKITIVVFIILIIILFIQAIFYIIHKNTSLISIAVNEYNIFTILQPLIMFIILIGFIGLFISFNTSFNKYVVYMCLDSSYKRSLNKLNNIVSPYIQMYDNKIIKSNKSYIHHYIIANVFYSILSGNITLNYPTAVSPAKPPVVPPPINEADDNIKYYNSEKIKDNSLKFASMNSSSLTNNIDFKTYYNVLFSGIYKEYYDITEAQKLYDVFIHIFNIDILPPTDRIISYFKKIISIDSEKGTLSKIYYIIKKCFELFDEEKFNNNLIFYNKENSNKIDEFNKFKFFKLGEKVIPYKFILTLNTLADYNEFIKVDDKVALYSALKQNLKDNFNIAVSDDITEANNTDVTAILDNTDVTPISDSATAATAAKAIIPISDSVDVSTQSSDIEKKKDKNLIKIIANYLLILGHMNYNRIQYNSADAVNKSVIYKLKTAYLYKLFSNTGEKDIYEIKDTFKRIGSDSSSPDITLSDNKYKNLTYIYNYLETKYVNVSSNNNKNYLMNVITSINNKINDNDDKTFNNNDNSTLYMFRDKIDNMNNSNKYENEEDILNIANEISTTSFATTYISNIVIMLICYYIISRTIK
jgi:hypothetical protein